MLIKSGAHRRADMRNEFKSEIKKLEGQIETRVGGVSKGAIKRHNDLKELMLTFLSAEKACRAADILNMKTELEKCGTQIAEHEEMLKKATEAAAVEAAEMEAAAQEPEPEPEEEEEEEGEEEEDADLISFEEVGAQMAGLYEAIKRMTESPDTTIDALEVV